MAEDKVLKTVNFTKKWLSIKKNFTRKDLHFFYGVVDIDNTCGRVLYYSGIGREYNPKYNSHFFASNRCHWNVVFPCWLLNGRNVKGKYKIITNSKHSAIYDSEKNIIFDPTLNGQPQTTLDFFKENYQIQPLILHIFNCDKDMGQRLLDFTPKSKREDLKIALKDAIDWYYEQPKEQDQ